MKNQLNDQEKKYLRTINNYHTKCHEGEKPDLATYLCEKTEGYDKEILSSLVEKGYIERPRRIYQKDGKNILSCIYELTLKGKKWIESSGNICS